MIKDELLSIALPCPDEPEDVGLGFYRFAHLIHVVGRRGDHDGVCTRVAEDSHKTVDGLVASCTHEDLLELHPSHLGHQSPHLNLIGVGVSVKR